MDLKGPEAFAKGFSNRKDSLAILTAASPPLLFLSAVARFLQAEAVVPVPAYGVQQGAEEGVDTLLSSTSARSGMPSRSISFFDGPLALEPGACR